jgi:hypothetical protein
MIPTAVIPEFIDDFHDRDRPGMRPLIFMKLFVRRVRGP